MRQSCRWTWWRVFAWFVRSSPRDRRCSRWSRSERWARSWRSPWPGGSCSSDGSRAAPRTTYWPAAAGRLGEQRTERRKTLGSFKESCGKFEYFDNPPHLLLSVLDGKFEPLKRHPLPVLVGGPGRVVVQEDFQLPRTPCVVQERRGKVHHLFP